VTTARSTVLRRLLVAAVLVAVAVAVSTQLHGVRRHLADLSAPALVGAEAALGCGLVTSLLAWRVLLTDLGSPLPFGSAARIFLVGQVGKYVPGSVWPVVTQMQLGAAADVPRRRSAAAALVALFLSVLAGFVVAAACSPFLFAQDQHELAVLGLAVLPVGLVACHPAVLNRLLALGLRVVRQKPLEHPLSGRAVVSAVALSCVTWVFNGLQAWLLAVDVGAPAGRALPFAVGGFALAAASGPLLVVLPAGAGVREAGVVVALSAVLPVAAATTVALTSRLLVTVADVSAAGLAALGARRVRGAGPSLSP
jgi:hypothetical protein